MVICERAGRGIEGNGLALNEGEVERERLFLVREHQLQPWVSDLLCFPVSKGEARSSHSGRPYSRTEAAFVGAGLQSLGST